MIANTSTQTGSEVTGPGQPNAGPSILGAAFTARGISVSIDGKTIVEDVSLTGYRGEIVGIIGPNGAGKTMLLKVLAGLMKPNSGEVEIGGASLNAMPLSSRSTHIAYVPQSTGAHPFTTLETVLMGRYPHLRRFQIEGEDDNRIALQALKRMDVVQFQDRRVDSLSGGERQRVLLARAMAQEAEMMFVDEPTSSLDIKHQLLSLQVLRDEAKMNGIAVCAVLHDLNLASRFCDRLLLMDRGRVISQGTPLEVITASNIIDVFGVHVRVKNDEATNRPNVELIYALD